MSHLVEAFYLHGSAVVFLQSLVNFLGYSLTLHSLMPLLVEAYCYCTYIVRAALFLHSLINHTVLVQYHLNEA